MVNLDFNYEEDELEQQERQEEEEIEAKKKKKRPGGFFLIAAIVLLLGLLGLGGWVIYDKSKKQSEWVSLQMSFDSSRASAKEEYNTVLQKMDSLSTTGLDLQNELESKKKEIESLNSDMEKIVKEKDHDLNAARQKIQELRAKIQDLMEEVESLKRQNEELIARKQAGEHFQVINGDTVVVNTRTLQFAEMTGKSGYTTTTSEGARPLRVTDMQVVPVSPDGAEKAGGLSKFTAGIKVTFVLAKDDAQASGSRELQLILSGPNAGSAEAKAVAAAKKPADARADPKATATTGKVDPNSGVTAGSGIQKVYTAKVNANYDKKKGTKVEYTWTPPTKLNAGDYKVDVLCQGNKIGEGRMFLKRGTKAFPF